MIRWFLFGVRYIVLGTLLTASGILILSELEIYFEHLFHFSYTVVFVLFSIVVPSALCRRVLKKAITEQNLQASLILYANSILLVGIALARWLYPKTFPPLFSASLAVHWVLAAMGCCVLLILIPPSVSLLSRHNARTLPSPD